MKTIYSPIMVFFMGLFLYPFFETSISASSFMHVTDEIEGLRSVRKQVEIIDNNVIVCYISAARSSRSHRPACLNLGERDEGVGLSPDLANIDIVELPNVQSVSRLIDVVNGVTIACYISASTRSWSREPRCLKVTQGFE